MSKLKRQRVLDAIAARVAADADGLAERVALPLRVQLRYLLPPLLLGCGLCVVGLSVYDASRLPIEIKVIGAGMVGMGMFLSLLRILFSYTPSFFTCQTISSLFHKQKKQGDISECQISVVSKSFNKDI